MNWCLFLDDERWPAGDPKSPSWNWTIARTVDDARWYVENYGIPQHISFDHDLGDRKLTGFDFARWFCDHVESGDIQLPPGFSYYVHSMNPVGAEKIRARMNSCLELLASG